MTIDKIKRQERLVFLAKHPELWDNPIAAYKALKEIKLYARTSMQADAINSVMEMIVLVKALKVAFMIQLESEIKKFSG